ncbi:hypothetical protein BpHYR1_007194 [Brachionus plicatilis]|uniref:Uncharacterized protein n=1 Tax=Brachionus plicatilis TaxID=10195 RepID=A0A3M7QY93_BRAPC|nr:hypothetical protein BpHYR1_007194 [Brachionus plicatilis]
MNLSKEKNSLRLIRLKIYINFLVCFDWDPIFCLTPNTLKELNFTNISLFRMFLIVIAKLKSNISIKLDGLFTNLQLFI